MLQGLGLYLKNISFLLLGFDAWRLDKMYMYTTKFLHHFISQVWEDDSNCHRPFGILLFDYIPILLSVWYTTPPFFVESQRSLWFFGGASLLKQTTDFDKNLGTVFAWKKSRKSVNHLEVGGSICLEDDDCQSLADEWTCADECA